MSITTDAEKPLAGSPQPGEPGSKPEKAAKRDMRPNWGLEGELTGGVPFFYGPDKTGPESEPRRCVLGTSSLSTGDFVSAT